MSGNSRAAIVGDPIHTVAHARLASGCTAPKGSRRTETEREREKRTERERESVRVRFHDWIRADTRTSRGGIRSWTARPRGETKMAEGRGSCS